MEGGRERRIGRRNDAAGIALVAASEISEAAHTHTHTLLEMPRGASPRAPPPDAHPRPASQQRRQLVRALCPQQHLHMRNVVQHCSEMLAELHIARRRRVTPAVGAPPLGQ
ncbi:hypothetical protein DQ04_10231020, partial [Trypanosoma grayi]|uniref:hypothetical protein n=1 Tax=Trypanosoma grayi TaxID=71804 RepID=UPI0004F414C9